MIPLRDDNPTTIRPVITVGLIVTYPTTESTLYVRTAGLFSVACSRGINGGETQ